MKNILIQTATAPARPRSKRLRALGTALAVGGASGSTGGTSSADSEALAEVRALIKSWGQLFAALDAAGNVLDLSLESELTKVRAIRAAHHLFSVADVAAFGPAASSGGSSGGGGGYELLTEWSQYTAARAGWALSAKLGWDLHQRATQVAADLASHTANAAAHVSATDRANWDGKVDSVSGKGLSANDFTTALLTKLNGIADGANKYVLPAASATVRGGVKVGSGLAIASDVLSVSLSASHIPALDWSKITTGKPTTLAGYGITDAYTAAQVNGKFVTLDTEQAITQAKTFVGCAVRIRHIARTGGSAISLDFRDPDNNRVANMGTLMVDGVLEHAYIGWGEYSYDETSCLAVSDTKIRYKGHAVLHAANYPSILDGRYYTESEVDTKLATKVSKAGDTMTGLLTLNAGAKIGDCLITWDATAGMLHFSKGIYSDKDVAAFGPASGSTSGGSAMGMLHDWPTTAPLHDTTDTISAYLGWGLRSDLSDLAARLTAVEGGAALSVTTSGSGNGVANVTKNGTELTVTKANFLTAHQNLDYIRSLDTRSVATLPNTYAASLRVSFKRNEINGLSDGGIFNGELHFKPYGPAGDNSGGYPHQMGFTSAGNIWHRYGASNTTWGAWVKLLDTANYAATLDTTHLRIDGTNGTAAGVSALINKLSAGASTPVDADYYVAQYAGGGTTTTTYHRRPVSALWNYIKGKADGVYLAASAYTAADILTKLKTVDGSGSGLDADTVDGVHAASFARGGCATYQSGTGPKWIRVAECYTTSMGIVSVTNLYRYFPSAGVTLAFSTSFRDSNSTYASLVQLSGVVGLFTKARLVYSANAGKCYIELYYNYATTNPLYVYFSNFHTNGGGILYAQTDGSIPDGYVAKELTLVSDGVSATRLRGALIGNADTATRLQGTYKLWGRDFYGNNVSGDLTGVGNIGFNADNTCIIGTNTAQARHIYAGGLYARTGSVLAFGANNGYHMRISTAGHVTIGHGTADKDYLLAVNGSLQANSLHIGLMSATWDTGATALRFDKTIYSTGDIVAFKGN